MSSTKRAAVYARVSTDAQTVENQTRELRQVAERRGWDVVEVYSDAGISGAKGRNGRPGLDSMLKDASRRKFDIVMAWAIDRLGRSLIDLLDTIQHLEACGVDLYLDQQAIDTTTPMGKLVFQVTGAFAEFERAMMLERQRPGIHGEPQSAARVLPSVVPPRTGVVNGHAFEPAETNPKQPGFRPRTARACKETRSVLLAAASSAGRRPVSERRGQPGEALPGRSDRLAIHDAGPRRDEGKRHSARNSAPRWIPAHCSRSERPG